MKTNIPLHQFGFDLMRPTPDRLRQLLTVQDRNTFEARAPSSVTILAPLLEVESLIHVNTVYTYSAMINLGQPEFSALDREVGVDLSDESRKLARELRRAFQVGDEVTELRPTKAFVRSLTLEHREELLRLI